MIKTFAIAAAFAALAVAVPVSAGRNLQGISLNGLQLNGLTTNGLQLNGLQLNGVARAAIVASADRAAVTLSVTRVTLPNGEVIATAAMPTSIGDLIDNAN